MILTYSGTVEHNNSGLQIEDAKKPLQTKG